MRAGPDGGAPVPKGFCSVWPGGIVGVGGPLFFHRKNPSARTTSTTITIATFPCVSLNSMVASFSCLAADRAEVDRAVRPVPLVQADRRAQGLGLRVQRIPWDG